MGNTPSSVRIASATCLLLGTGIVWLQKICTSSPEWIRELEQLGQPRKRKLAGTAVVCGGSASGIVAARVLADHFERVLIVDPELQEPEKPKTRIMQYNASHVLLTLFTEGARRLWPNHDAELEAVGGRTAFADIPFYYSGVQIPTPFGEDAEGDFPTALALSRPAIQKGMHNLLVHHPTASNIKIISGTVRGVEASADGKSLTSVNIRNADGTQTVINDVGLVVDATGALQSGLKWLESAGFSLPANIRCSYNPNIHYATMCFVVPPAIEAMLPIPESATKYLGQYIYSQHVDFGPSVTSFVKTENNTMLLLLTSSQDNLPRTTSEIVPFLSTVRGHEPLAPWFVRSVELLCEHCEEPSFDIIKLPRHSYVKYHTALSALPSNYIAFGDAHMQLNPLYAQGFAKLMMNAITLNTILHSLGDPSKSAALLPKDFAVRYFKKYRPRTEGLWDFTRFHDYGSASCEPMDGETRDHGRTLRWFELKSMSAALKYPEVASVLWYVRNMMVGDIAFMTPTVLWKILWTKSRF
ncbi:hypothetical protein R3P38DRAFT_3071158, partial [Favolaschia claudopus]